jgi:hypothetical protein
MTTIVLPPDLENRLTEEALRRGTKPEILAVDALRRLFPAPLSDDAAMADSLFDFLASHIGAVAGSAEPLSEECGRRFADGLIEKQQRVRP